MDTRPNGPQIAVFIDFENVATSAEANFGDFDVTAVMDLLRTRGRLLIKRAYGDWGRFHRYRRAMLENGIDLFQLYSVGVQQKNRADVRLAIDALETVFTRPSIDLYVIVSGDSDFTELIHKLRDYGKYTIGIGLRAATSDLLRRACDEFIFYETLVTEEAMDISDELRLPDPRELLRRALSAAEQKGDLPIYAGRLKQIMLNLDSSFSEANYGFQQFRAFLEAYPDLVAIEEQGLQLFVSMRKPTPPAVVPPPPAKPVAVGALPSPQTWGAGGPSSPPQVLPAGGPPSPPQTWGAGGPPSPPQTWGAGGPSSSPQTSGAGGASSAGGAAEGPGAGARASAAQAGRSQSELEQRYRSFFRDAGLRIVDGATRRRVAADFLATVRSHPEALSLHDAADLLQDRYDAENALPLKLAVPDVMRLLIMSAALRFAGGQPCSHAPILQAELPGLDQLVRACERVYVWRLVEGGMPLDPAHLTRVLYDADTGKDAVVGLCRDLVADGKIVPQGDGYSLAPEQIGRLLQRPELALPADHLAREPLPANEPVSPHTAESLFREGSELRQKDFAGSAQRYLQAARIQLEALRMPQARAGFDDLKWYLASYCSVKAGHAFVSGNYSEAIPYYLAFFGLAQEADCVWPRIQRLVNPMASYYYAIAGKQFEEAVPANLGRSPAHQVALKLHNHANPQVVAAWEDLIRRLAVVNLGIVRQTYREVADQAASLAQAGGENLARVEHTRAFLAGLIAEREGM